MFAEQTIKELVSYLNKGDKLTQVLVGKTREIL